VNPPQSKIESIHLKGDINQSTHLRAVELHLAEKKCEPEEVLVLPISDAIGLLRK